MNRRKVIRVTLRAIGAAILLAGIIGTAVLWRIATDSSSVAETLHTDPDFMINAYFTDLSSDLTDEEVVKKWFDEDALLDRIFGFGAWHRVDDSTRAAARAQVRPLLVTWVQQHRAVCQGGTDGPVRIAPNGVNAVGLPEATGSIAVTTAGAATTLFIDVRMDDSAPVGAWKAFNIGEGKASLLNSLGQRYETAGRPADFVIFLTGAASESP